MAEEPVGWSVVLGVWYDLKDGQPSMELLMLPGKKIDYLTELHLIDGHYYLVFGENEEELNVSLDEFEQILRQKNIPFSVFRVDIRDRKNLEKLYAWHAKVLEHGGFLQLVTISDVDAKPLFQAEFGYVLSKEMEHYHKLLLDGLRELYGPSKQLPAVKNSSIELEMIGPIYVMELLEKD